MIIILHQYEFTNFHFSYYDVDELKRNKIKFEVHDLSKAINDFQPKIFKNDKAKFKELKKFNSLFDWFKYISKKKEKIFIYNLLVLNNFKSLIIFYLLKFLRFTIIIDTRVGVYNNYNKKKKIKFFDLKKKFITIYKNPRSLSFFLKNKFLIFLTTLVQFQKIVYLICGKRKNNRLFMLKLRSKSKNFVDFNSPDYSKILKNKYSSNKNKKKIAIFLDGPGPFFPNDRELFGFRDNYDKKKWYSELNNFFNKIEKQFSLKILIIPHPKNLKMKNPYYDKKFSISRIINSSHYHTKNAKMVFSITGSTAISYSVYYKKPITLLYNNQMLENFPNKVNYLLEMSKNLNCNLINISKKFDFKKINKFNINSKLYNNYIYNFLTNKKIKETPNGEIFKHIQNTC